MKVLLAEDIETTSEVATVTLVELGPVDQDTDFTVYVPAENTNVMVGPEDYSNAVYVQPQDNTVYVPARDLNFNVAIPSQNTQVRIAA